MILDLFDNYTNLEFNKINILKQGVLTPCIDKKNLGYRTYLLINFYRFLQMTKNVKEGENCRIQRI